MLNIDALIKSVITWIKPIVLQAIPSVNVPANSKIAGSIGKFFGVDLSSYNIIQEFSFLAEPILDNYLAPVLKSRLSQIPDEAVPQVANSFIDACIKQASDKGFINIYGFEFSAQSFQNLKNEFNSSLTNVKN